MPATRHPSCIIQVILTRCPANQQQANWLRLNEEGQLAQPIAARVTPERIAAYVAGLRAQVSTGTVAGYILALCSVTQALAPGLNWQWLWDVANRLKRVAQPPASKIGRILPSKALLSLGIELMQEAERQSDGVGRHQAASYRDGLIIALLAARPFRISNFASIEIGRHLVKQGDGFFIRFAASETKTRKALEAGFPAALIDYL